MKIFMLPQIVSHAKHQLKQCAQTIACCCLLAICNSGLAHPTHHTAAPAYLSHVTAAVVNIAVQKKMDPQVFDMVKKQENLPDNLSTPQLGYMGSGVIMDTKLGTIITNNHVVKDAENIIVTLKSGDHYLAHVLHNDPSDDLAIIQIKAKEPLTSIAIANSDQARIGQNVMAIGHPFGLNESVTAGIISATDRSLALSADHTQTFLQTDAPINPGNSGGALINNQGKLIGINTAIISHADENAGIGFSIPSNTVVAVYHQLMTHGKVVNGMLGIIAQNMTPRIASAMGLTTQPGVVITQINPHSAADQAGLHNLDVINAVNHTPIHNILQLHHLLSLKRPGTIVHINITRAGKAKLINATLSDAQHAALTHITAPDLMGMQLETVDQLQANNQRLQGVQVKSVQPTSHAALAGVRAGDIIMQANLHPIHNLDQLIQQDTTKNTKKPMLLILNHHGIKDIAVIN